MNIIIIIIIHLYSSCDSCFQIFVTYNNFISAKFWLFRKIPILRIWDAVNCLKQYSQSLISLYLPWLTLKIQRWCNVQFRVTSLWRSPQDWSANFYGLSSYIRRLFTHVADNSNTHTHMHIYVYTYNIHVMYHADELTLKKREKEREKPDTSSSYSRYFVKEHAQRVFGGVILHECDPRDGWNRMKWCDVDRSRVSLLQSRHYPLVSTKNRRRHIAQETKDIRPITMHHQLHVGYNGIQGGTMSREKSLTLFTLIATYSYLKKSDTMRKK